MIDFQNLIVYGHAKQFHIDCKNLIQTGKFDRYVSDQLLRASFSVPLNIAEGAGKFSYADRKRYFTTARASVYECVAILDIIKELNLISQDDFARLSKQGEVLCKILYKMISTLSMKAV